MAANSAVVPFLRCAGWLWLAVAYCLSSAVRRDGHAGGRFVKLAYLVAFALG